MARSKGRTGRPWLRHRQALLDSDTTTCAWPPCGQHVDKTLPGTHKWGPSANHITPLMLGGEEHGPLNLMHTRCNSVHGQWVRATLRAIAQGYDPPDPYTFTQRDRAQKGRRRGRRTPELHRQMSQHAWRGQPTPRASRDW